MSSASGSSVNSAPWPALLPLGDPMPPPFPTEVLPGWLRSMVEQLAESTQTPADLAGLLAFAAVATVVHGRARMRVKVDYTEPLNLYVVVGLRPGARKSAVFGEITKPLEALEAELAAKAAPGVDKAQSELRMLEKRLQREEEAAAKEGIDAERLARQQRAQELAAEVLAAKQKMPELPRLIADDVTPEALASLLAAHGRIAVMSAEGGIFETLAGRYSNGVANIDVFLKGHAGDALRVDRRGRPPEQVEHPAITLAVAVQPSVIAGLHDKPGFRGRGLLARPLYAVPPSNIGHRKTDTASLPVAVSDEYRRLVRGLALRAVPPELTLTVSAYHRWLEAAEALEPRLGDDGDLVAVTEWASKLMGALGRIAGLLHLAEYADADAIPSAVDDQTMLRALALSDYLIGHARAAFALMGPDRATEDAETVLAWIRREALSVFTRRDAYRALRSRFHTADEIDRPLGVLTELAYIRPLESERAGPVGRKPAPQSRYEVNPAVQNRQNRQNGAVHGSVPTSVNSVPTSGREEVPL